MATMETTGMPTAEDLMREREALTRERGRLAWHDPDGDALRLVKARLDEIESRLTDRTLAEREAQADAVGAAAKAQAQQVAQAQIRAAGLLAESRVEIEEGEIDVDRGLTRLRRAMALRRDAYRVLAVAGRAPAARGFLGEAVVRGAMAWKLRDLLGGHKGDVRRPPLAYRRSLRELLAQADAEANPPAAGEATAPAPAEEGRG